MPGSSTLNNIDRISVEGWLYLDGYGENNLGRFFTRSGGGNQVLLTGGTLKSIQFEAMRWDTTDGKWRTANDSIQVGQWYHIVVTYDYGSVNNDPIIYINGEPSPVTEVQAPAGTAAATDTATIYLGNNSLTGDRTFDGRIDEVAFYDYLLSPAAVKQHYGDITEYGYDDLYRLTDVRYPNGDAQTYTYDPMGNRLSKTENGVPTTYSYDGADQMTLAGGVTYTYDDNGNQIEAGTDTFEWDAENRLIETNIASATGTYAFNGDGLRSTRTIGASPVSYVWDLNASLPVILQDTDGNRYVYGIDLLTRIDGAQEEWYLYDGLGSTTGLADNTGAVTGTYEYDVFGAVRAQIGGVTEWSYTGEQTDPTGLGYLRARYYQPETGRFLARDPLPLLHRYGYVGNNPVNYIDPHGLCKKTWKPWEAAKECVDKVEDATAGVREYIADKTHDAVDLAEHCVQSLLTCGTDAASFGISLTCHGDRHDGPGGWSYYANSRGGCEFMWQLFGDDKVACYTPGYLTFCREQPSERLRCHEFQHYLQSRVLPSGAYWVTAADFAPGEGDAERAENNKESHFPFTNFASPVQCR